LKGNVVSVDELCRELSERKLAFVMPPVPWMGNIRTGTWIYWVWATESPLFLPQLALCCLKHCWIPMYTCTHQSVFMRTLVRWLTGSFAFSVFICTVGLASHWPCVTDNSGITTYRLTALGREMSTPPKLQ